jgi:hypothetical protein
VSDDDAAQDSGSPLGDTEAQAEADSDVLITSYRTILNELALLTTVSVLLFGFLLANAGQFADSTGEEWVSAIATVLVASATLVFILPVAYHHLQFPYRDFAKFQARSHRWVLFGVPLLAGGLYLCLCLALWSLFGAWAIVVAGIPIAAAAIFFILRKGQL